MKRIHLFEFEDLAWFPRTIRDIGTKYIVAMHKLLKSKDDLIPLINKGLLHATENQIIDLCSGAGGPLPLLSEDLRKKNSGLEITCTDLYPNLAAAKQLAPLGIVYKTSPVNATQVPKVLKGLRTMICSFHHLKPDQAKGVINDAVKAKQPLLIYEISDNATPTFLWWISIPFTFIFSFFIMPMVRPFGLKEFVFTYLIPIVPLFIAWDGSVSNVRTYTISDLEELQKDIDLSGYVVEQQVIKAKPAGKIYSLLYPKPNA